MKKNASSSWSLNRFAALLFVVVIFFSVNFIGYKKYFRKDYSVNQYLALSPQTLKVIRSLPNKVTIISFLAQEGDVLSGIIKDDVDNLLKEYQYQSRGKIDVRQVNPFTDFEEAQRIVEKFKLTKSEDVLIVEYGEQSRVLKVSDLAVMDSSGLIYGDPPTVKAFRGEVDVTNAIMGLVQGKSSKIYFTTGHGEPDPEAPESDLTGISALSDRVKGQNAEVHKLDMTKEGKIPEDADMVVVLGPKFPFTSDEISSLSSYLEHNGRLFLLLDPQHKTELEKFLEPYGVTFADDMVLRPVFVALPNSEVTQGITMDAVGVSFADHPAINWIKQTGSNLPLGVCRSVIFKQPAEKPQNPTEVTALVQTSDKTWGETQYSKMEMETPTFDSKTDYAGPLTLAAAIDLGAVQGGQVNLKGPKIVVVGGASFLANKQIGSLQADFFLNAMNWMLEKKESLGITPKVPKSFSLKMTDTQRQSLTALILIFIPLLGMVMGAYVWVRRRR